MKNDPALILLILYTRTLVSMRISVGCRATAGGYPDWLDIMSVCLYLSGTVIVTTEAHSSMVHGSRVS